MEGASCTLNPSAELSIDVGALSGDLLRMEFRRCLFCFPGAAASVVDVVADYERNFFFRGTPIDLFFFLEFYSK